MTEVEGHAEHTLEGKSPKGRVSDLTEGFEGCTVFVHLISAIKEAESSTTRYCRLGKDKVENE